MEKLYKHPWLIIIAAGIITVFFAFQLPKTELDNNNIRFVPEYDEARQTNTYIDENFGSSYFILVALERKYGDVFDSAFLNRIREFISRIEDIDIVDDVNSIVSSDYIFAEGDSIVVQKLVGENFTGTQEEIAVLKERILSWDMYRRSLVSDDFRATQILIPLDINDEMASRPENIDKYIEIRDIAREMFAGYSDVYVTGMPVISASINESMRADLVTMLPIVAVVVILVLFFSFRHLTPVLLPLITVLVAAVWSVGAMALFDIKLSIISTVIPVILVAVGSAYGIHIVTHYTKALNEALNSSDGMSKEEHTALVLSIVRKIGKAVFLAALTTMAGFSSFCFTRVIPIREFGIFVTFGVLVTFFMAVLFIPALLIIRGPRRISSSASLNENGGKADSKIAVFFANITHKRKAVIFTAILIIPFCIWGISKVVIDNIFVEWFKTSSEIYRSDQFIREKFGGSKIVNVVIQADDTETLLMPEVLLAMDGLSSYLEDRVSEAGKVISFTDLVKRINQVFNADESPDGLRPVQSSFNDNDGFGFSLSGSFETSSDENFGFGDFGFTDFGFRESTPNADSPTNDILYSSYVIDDYLSSISADEMVSLLRRAVSSGSDRFMDANTLVREMEKLINYEGMAYYEIPADPQRYGKTYPEELSQLVSNYLILLSGNISSYANDPLSPTAIKSAVQLRTIGNVDSSRAIDSISEYIDDNFPENINTVIGGTSLVEISLNNLVVESQIVSVIISVLVVFFIITIVNRSFIAGLVGITPLFICILINFAIMGFTGIKLNIGTSLMASLCVGIGVDYAIHFMEAYKREYLAARGKSDFLLKAFATSGKAIIINAVSVGAGFAVLVFSQFVMLKDLGLLMAFTMGTSALVSLIVIPALLLTIKPKFIYQGERS